MIELQNTKKVFRQRTDDSGSVIPRYLFWTAILILYVLLHVPYDVTINLSGGYIASTILLPLRRLLYVSALVVIAMPFIVCVMRSRESLASIFTKQDAVNALAVFGFVGCLVYALDSPHLCRDMGYYYGEMSDAPFRVEFGAYHRRLLKPVLAHLFFMRGQYLYFLFSMMLTYGVILMTLLFYKMQFSNALGSTPKEQHSMPLLWAVSLGTCSFISYDFANPGYPDNLVFFLVLTALMIRPHAQAQLSLLVLCLAIHEASLFILAPLFLVLFPRRLWIPAGAIVGIYGLGLMISANVSAAGLTAHTEVFGKSPLNHVLENPSFALLGTFFSYKLLWIIPVICATVLRKKLPWRAQAMSILLLVAPLGLIPLAFDTSRLVGFGFLGIILCIAPLHAYAQKHRALLLLLHVLFLANLLLPSMVSYISGPWYPRGLYGLEIDILAPPAVKRSLWNR
jgi:hypothetical protein